MKIRLQHCSDSTVRRRSCLKRVAFGTVLVGIVLALIIGTVELAYRFQLLDTYRPELDAYNPPDVTGDAIASPTLLAMGDSFTAGTASYPEVLRALLPGWRIINGGVSGTCVIQANIIAPRRLRRFKPDVCVYQIFAGNDLFDIRYPAGGERLTSARRGYWFLASHLRALSFINYRLGQRTAGSPSTYASSVWLPNNSDIFSIDRFDQRERLYLATEPSLLENQVLVLPPRADDYERLLQGLARIRAMCRKSNTTLVLLLIPHAVQVAPVYMDRMRQIGATFTAPERMMALDYPFLSGIRNVFSNDSAVVVLDTLATLQAAERDGTPVYFANDGHLNRAGQDRVAQVVFDAVIKIYSEGSESEPLSGY